jgi:hypothetical protein
MTLSKEKFKEMLQHKIAGETISWKEYERFNIGALPKTLRTLMNVAKAEAFMEAQQDKFKMTKGMVIGLGAVFMIVIIIIVVITVAQGQGWF